MTSTTASAIELLPLATQADISLDASSANTEIFTRNYRPCINVEAGNVLEDEHLALMKLSLQTALTNFSPKLYIDTTNERIVVELIG